MSLSPVGVRQPSSTSTVSLQQKNPVPTSSKSGTVAADAIKGKGPKQEKGLSLSEMVVAAFAGAAGTLLAYTAYSWFKGSPLAPCDVELIPGETRFVGQCYNGQPLAGDVYRELEDTGLCVRESHGVYKNNTLANGYQFNLTSSQPIYYGSFSKDGHLLEGTYWGTDSDGEYTQQGHFVNGKLEGQGTELRNGIVWLGSFKEGLRHGMGNTVINGRVAGESIYVDGKLSGGRLEPVEDGRWDECINNHCWIGPMECQTDPSEGFYTCVRNGTGLSYDREVFPYMGTLFHQLGNATYNNGTLVEGQAMTFHHNGALYQVGRFLDEKLTEGTEFFNNNTWAKRGVFNENGEFTHGDLRTASGYLKGNFINDKLNGTGFECDFRYCLETEWNMGNRASSNATLYEIVGQGLKRVGSWLKG